MEEGLQGRLEGKPRQVSFLSKLKIQVEERGVCTENLNSDVVVMKSAKDRV